MNFLAIIIAFYVQAVCVAYPTFLKDDSLGRRAASYDQSFRLWGRMDLAGTDGQVKVAISEETSLDRRIDGYFVVGGERAFTDKVGVRLNVGAQYSKRRVGVDENFSDETIWLAEPSAEIIYKTPTGIELNLAANYFLVPSYKHSEPNGSTEFSEAAFIYPSFAIVKRGASFVGTFYYLVGAETTRTVKKTGADGTSLSTSSKIAKPSRAGLLGVVETGSAEYEAEFAAVFAGEGGERTDDGVTKTEDHLFARVLAQLKLEPFNPFLQFTYQTQSYSNNAFIALETIPLLTVRLGIGALTRNSWLALFAAYGSDRQSLPEFNATYEVKSFGLSLLRTFE